MALSTQTRIARSIGRSKRDVFLRIDFAKLGTPSRVTRAISELINRGKLVKLGYGVYAKAVPSPVTGNPIPRKVLESLVIEAFESLGIRMEDESKLPKSLKELHISSLRLLSPAI